PHMGPCEGRSPLASLPLPTGSARPPAASLLSSGEGHYRWSGDRLQALRASPRQFGPELTFAPPGSRMAGRRPRAAGFQGRAPCHRNSSLGGTSLRTTQPLSLARAGQEAAFFLAKHAAGDRDEEDAARNEQPLREGHMLWSRYRTLWGQELFVGCPDFFSECFSCAPWSRQYRGE